MAEVTIYTDGACSGNPGPGGWAAVMVCGEHSKEISGYEESTTNNRMELTAAIKALQALKFTCDVKIYTDSAYLCNAFKMNWIGAWQKNGFRTAKKEPVENQDLWLELLRLAGVHSISWHKVQGHADNPRNNRCDVLARGEIKKTRALAAHQ